MPYLRCPVVLMRPIAAPFAILLQQAAARGVVVAGWQKRGCKGFSGDAFLQNGDVVLLGYFLKE